MRLLWSVWDFENQGGIDLSTNDCIQAMNFYWEEQTLKFLRDLGILSEEEYLGILEIAEKQTNLRKVCCKA